MSKIPPELENLMWTLAESGNQQAVSEFEARFPHLKLELAKRTSMVRTLRSTRPGNVTSPAIPRFVPGPTAAPEPSRGMYTAAFVFAAIALSVFAYTAVFARHPKPIEQPSLPHMEVATAPTQQPTMIPESTAPVNPGFAPPPTISPNDGSTPHSLRDEPPILSAPPEHTWNRPQTIAMQHVPLQTVLQAVAEEGRLSIDMAPGMPNPTISVDYHDISAENILKDLGKTYAFTPLLSDDGSAIMIPAVPRSGTSATANHSGQGQ